MEGDRSGLLCAVCGAGLALFYLVYKEREKYKQYKKDIENSNGLFTPSSFKKANVEEGRIVMIQGVAHIGPSKLDLNRRKVIESQKYVSSWGPFAFWLMTSHKYSSFSLVEPKGSKAEAVNVTLNNSRGRKLINIKQRRDLICKEVDGSRVTLQSLEKLVNEGQFITVLGISKRTGKDLKVGGVVALLAGGKEECKELLEKCIKN